MIRRAQVFLLGLIVLTAASSARAEAAGQAGQADLDEAMRLRVNANDMADLHKVIMHLEQALDKGLDDENGDFAEQMLSGALMERASIRVRAVINKPINDPRMQRVRRSAENDLRQVLVLDAPPPEARLMLAKLLVLPDGDRREARRQLDAYLELDELTPEERTEALMLRGRVQINFEKALADFDQAILLEPDVLEHQITRVLLLRAHNKADDALTAVEDLLEVDAENAAALLMMGEILREQGKLEQALAVFEQIQELVPEEPAPYQQGGEIYRELEEFDKAIDQFTRLLEVKPDSILPRIHRAEANVQAGQHEQAVADVDAILEKHPDFVPAVRMKAEIFASQQDWDRAIDVLQEFSERAPHVAEVSLQLAIYHLVDKQPQAAIEAYSRALIADSDNFLALRGRGDAYLNVGDHHAALSDFERAIQVESDDPELLNNFAWLLATSPDDDVRDGKRAIELARQASEATEYKKPHVLSTLAAAYAETGDFASAREWSQKAVAMNDPVHGDQLAKELKSYEEEKPWRERQTVDAAENDETAEASQEAEETAQDPEPATPIADSKATP